MKPHQPIKIRLLRRLHGYVLMSFVLNVVLILGIVVYTLLITQAAFLERLWKGISRSEKGVTLLREAFPTTPRDDPQTTSHQKHDTPNEEKRDDQSLFQGTSIRLERDPYMRLVSLKQGDKARRDPFLDQIRTISGFKVYAIVVFRTALTPYMIKELRRQDLRAATGFMHQYIGKTTGLFAMRTDMISPLERLSNIKEIYLLKTFTAHGYYRLTLLPEKSIDSIRVTFHLPYSKAGRTLLSRDVSLYGTDGMVDHVQENAFLQIYSSMKRGRPMTYVCRLSYKVDVPTLIAHEVSFIGRTISLETYQKAIQKEVIYKDFVAFSEKIRLNDYVHEVAKSVNTHGSLWTAWQDITTRLNRDIRYNAKKRHLFFSGQLAYHNIKDMYMTTQELANVRVGACPERSSLEAAVLRRLGIPSRTTTRLYHIYVEIYFPRVGWVSTSSTLDEIPLCHSLSADQSYFVSWEPNHPIRLKWEGHLRPIIGD